MVNTVATTNITVMEVIAEGTMSYGPCGSWGQLHIGLGSAMGRGLCNQVVTGRSLTSETLLELKSSFPRPESQLLGDAVWL